MERAEIARIQKAVMVEREEMEVMATAARVEIARIQKARVEMTGTAVVNQGKSRLTVRRETLRERRRRRRSDSRRSNAAIW